MNHGSYNPEHRPEGEITTKAEIIAEQDKHMILPRGIFLSEKCGNFVRVALPPNRLDSVKIIPEHEKLQIPRIQDGPA